ncbi:hypothetical protein CcrColossus_gp016 [Caulobacter phage CcrColossus]|uniref:Uncharacterized protein n=1 Tax=Caulobacter phage CcrColossus TaxID=1211640 RepID=K4JS28_9CAUD|nr:hypothetical protein CcrColossus_gp016 [Caulobacter phage CcrColossus]AFU87886.1 hypothetical protein CcrColossus_gp016 [Caulobacter phage CcrColossus]
MNMARKEQAGSYQIGIWGVERIGRGVWEARANGPGTLGDGSPQTFPSLGAAHLALTGEPMSERPVKPAAAPKPPRLPWSDLKVAYGLDNPDRFWRALDAGKLDLPAGWTVNETDCSGCRCVVVFRVETLPTVEDGRKVAKIVRRFGR